MTVKLLTFKLPGLSDPEDRRSDAFHLLKKSEWEPWLYLQAEFSSVKKCKICIGFSLAQIALQPKLQGSMDQKCRSNGCYRWFILLFI